MWLPEQARPLLVCQEIALDGISDSNQDCLDFNVLHPLWLAANVPTNLLLFRLLVYILAIYPALNSIIYVVPHHIIKLNVQEKLSNYDSITVS